MSSFPADSSTNPIVLSQVALQHDFSNVFADIGENTVFAEDIFLSCYHLGLPSVHGKVNVRKDESGASPGGILLESRDGVELTRLDHSHTFTVSCPPLSIFNTVLRAPRQTFSFNSSQTSTSIRRISSFDVSADASLIATGHYDGTISIESVSPSTDPEAPKFPLTSKKLHLSTVLSLRFFPSNKVLLSASSDLSLNIISAIPGSDSNPLEPFAVPRTLKGHKAAVTDTAILGVGRRVLSCSKDGSVRLWDVSKEAKISALTSDQFAPIMRMAVSGHSLAWSGNESWNGHLPPDGLLTSTSVNEQAVSPSDVTDTYENVIYTVLQNGAFNVLDLRTRNLIYASPPSRISASRASLCAVAQEDNSHFLATGSQGGIINVYDIRYLPSESSSTPSSVEHPSLFSFQRSNSPIDDLHFVPPNEGKGAPDLLIAVGDGFPFRASLHPDGPKVVEELIGFADESVTVVRTDGRGTVWAAGHDGIVRKY